MSETCGECFCCHRAAMYACLECGVALCSDCIHNNLCSGCYEEHIERCREEETSDD
jgi:hypothetical protein